MKKSHYHRRHNNHGSIRYLIKRLIKLALYAVSACIAVFGFHGIWAYFSYIEALFGENTDKLFFEISTPFPEAIFWMTVKGYQSWFIPLLFVALGAGLFYSVFRYMRGRYYAAWVIRF